MISEFLETYVYIYRLKDEKKMMKNKINRQK